MRRSAQKWAANASRAFDGWTKRFTIPADYEPLPVSAPRTGLLRSSWQWYGRIDPFERPGPLAQA